MIAVREYLLSVTSGAILCGILSSLTGENRTLSGLYKLISGIFLSLLVIAPLTQVNIRDFTHIADDLIIEGEYFTEEGQEHYDYALRQIITEETRAYIMDKARSYGAEIEVEVTLTPNEPPVPSSCIVNGTISPYVKQQLKKVLISDLGIPEENLTWIP